LAEQDDVRLYGRLASRSKRERDRIQLLSERTAEDLAAWAEPFPLMRQVRILPLCLSVTAAAPFCDVPALLSTARMSLWVFALDDLFDEEALPRSQLIERADNYKAIAHGQTKVGKDQEMAKVLLAIRQDLRSYPLFEPLEELWATSLCATVDEMVREYDWRIRYRNEGAVMLPTYEAYLDCGRFSIGGPPHVWSALITVGDASTPSNLVHLQSMERIASTCIRLANDIQSYQKEIEEGKFNALVILGHVFERQGHSRPTAQRMAEHQVRREIAQGLARLSELQSATRTETGHPEAAVADIARFVCEFYDQQDFHSFGTAPE
jgi:hypothetical protein